MTTGLRDAVTGTTEDDIVTMEADGTFSSTAAAVNRYSGERVSVAGYNRSFDTYDLGDGTQDIVFGTSGDDALFHSTAGSGRVDGNGVAVASAAHLAGVDVLVMGEGDDLVDLTAGAAGALSHAEGTDIAGDLVDPEDPFAPIDAACGADVLWGGLGSDTLLGDHYAMAGTTAGANDRLHGGAGDDNLFGDPVFFGSVGGDDVLDGGAGNDTLYGEAIFVGNAAICGDDTLTGGSGDDTLVGDLPDPSAFTGARGADTFVFGPDSGHDTIADFQPGVDTLRISTAYGPDEFAELFTSGLDDTLISFDGDATANDVLLTGVPFGALTADDVEFFA
jgi:Ca2+-binding RTX toxin-like protein